MTNDWCRLFLLMFASVLISGLNPARAELVAYGFTGQVTHMFPQPTSLVFGITMLPGDTVSGRFIFDTNSSGTGNADSASYTQDISAGLSIELAKGTVRQIVASTSNYTVDVKADDPSSDLLTVFFLSVGSAPFHPPSLVVNGETKSGQYQLNFRFPANSFADASLNSLKNAPAFSLANGAFRQTVARGAEFSITSLVPVPVPEPATGVISLGFATIFLLRWRRKLR